MSSPFSQAGFAYPGGGGPPPPGYPGGPPPGFQGGPPPSGYPGGPPPGFPGGPPPSGFPGGPPPGFPGGPPPGFQSGPPPGFQGGPPPSGFPGGPPPGFQGGPPPSGFPGGPPPGFQSGPPPSGFPGGPPPSGFQSGPPPGSFPGGPPPPGFQGGAPPPPPPQGGPPPPPSHHPHGGPPPSSFHGVPPPGVEGSTISSIPTLTVPPGGGAKSGAVGAPGKPAVGAPGSPAMGGPGGFLITPEMRNSLRKTKGGEASTSFQASSSGTGHHSYSASEMRAFTLFVNNTLQGDPDLAHVLPINPDSEDIFAAAKDGVLLCKLLHAVRPDSLDMRQVSLKPRNKFEALINHRHFLAACSSLGFVVVNIGAEDLYSGEKGYLIHALLWQTVRHALLSKVNVGSHPELAKLMKDGESASDFVNLPAEENLLRWANFHLANAGYPKRLTNFGKDIADSEAYVHLLHRLSPSTCTLDALSVADPLARAEKMLQGAERLGCRQFVTPADVVGGNEKLNLAFVATLFHEHPGIAPPDESEASRSGSHQRSLEEALQARYREEEAKMRAKFAEEQQKLIAEMEREREEMRRTMRQSLEEQEQAKRKQFEEEAKRLAAERKRLEDERHRFLEEQERLRKQGEEAAEADRERQRKRQEEIDRLHREQEELERQRREQEEQERRRREEAEHAYPPTPPDILTPPPGVYPPPGYPAPGVYPPSAAGYPPGAYPPPGYPGYPGYDPNMMYGTYYQTMAPTYYQSVGYTTVPVVIRLKK